MIPIETIAYISAIIILGLFTSMIASFLKLSKEVNEQVKSTENRFIERRTERNTVAYEKLLKTIQKSPTKTSTEIIEPLSQFWRNSALIDFELIHEILEGVYDMQKNLRSLKNAIFGAIVLFSTTIFISITVYSSYSIITFLIGFLALFYASYN